MTYLLLLSCLSASILLLALWCPRGIQLLLHVSCSLLPAAGKYINTQVLCICSGVGIFQSGEPCFDCRESGMRSSF